MDYKIQALSIIEQAGILDVSSLSMLNEYKEELKEGFLNGQVFRTRTEMEASVLNDLKFPTPDSKYWQSIREQNVHFHELVMLSYEYRKNIVEIKKLERDYAKEEDELEKELIGIEIEKKKFIALNQERTAAARISEIQNWHEIKERLIPELQHSLTDVNEHQLASYTRRWINQFIGAGDSGSIPERNNLLAQLDKGIKLCRDKDILKDILSEFGTEVSTALIRLGVGELKEGELAHVRKLSYR